jgi:hypothetical protein
LIYSKLTLFAGLLHISVTKHGKNKKNKFFKTKKEISKTKS